MEFSKHNWATNLNKLNLTEIELFIKMLYGDWSSLQPDHETNKSPRRMQVNPPARNDDRSPISNIWRSLISFLFRGYVQGNFLILKRRLSDRLESTTALLPVVWSQRSMIFFKIGVTLDKSKPTRVALIWLRVTLNRTRLFRAAHFARNEIKYQKRRESGLFQYNLYVCTIACLSFIPRYKQEFYKCYSLSPS